MGVIKKIILYSLLFPLFIFISISTTPGTFLANSEFGHFFSYFINLDRFEVNIDESIPKESIIITWNDELVYKQGHIYKVKREKRYLHGAVSIDVFYNKKRIYNFSFDKCNNWYFHRGIFDIKKVNSKIKVEVDIIGPMTMPGSRSFENIKIE